MKKHILWLICLLLLLGWMGMIFGFSSQTGEESGGLSAIIAEPVTDAIVQARGGMEDADREALYMQVDHAIRTAAHFSEYAILGALLLQVLRGRRGRGLVLTILVGVVFALLDEWRQYHTPGRVFDLMDILVDSLGVVCGAALTAILQIVWRKKYVHNP